MGIFGSNKTDDVIFLIPVDEPEEKLPRGKVRMLYCDSRGKVYTTIMDKSVHKTILDDIDRMEAGNRCYATVGLHICPGVYAPTVVEITSEDSMALSHALEHALRGGIIPDVLGKYIKRIIKLGGFDNRNSQENNNRETGSSANVMPRVLDRLPYYLERDMEFSMPVYKAEHKFPLIIVKRMNTDGNNGNSGQRLLILDNDGDLAFIKIPFNLLDRAEKRLDEWAVRNNKQACLILNRESGGYSINFIIISEAQRRALDVIASNCEDLGSGKQTISTAAQRVLAKAREAVLEPVE